MGAHLNLSLKFYQVKHGDTFKCVTEVSLFLNKKFTSWKEYVKTYKTRSVFF